MAQTVRVGRAAFLGLHSQVHDSGRLKTISICLSSFWRPEVNTQVLGRPRSLEAPGGGLPGLSLAPGGCQHSSAPGLRTRPSSPCLQPHRTFSLRVSVALL